MKWAALIFALALPCFGLSPRVEVTGNFVRIKWQSQAGASYKVEWTRDFHVWTLLATVNGTGGECVAIDFTSEGKRFYRVTETVW